VAGPLRRCPQQQRRAGGLFFWSAVGKPLRCFPQQAARRHRTPSRTLGALAALTPTSVNLAGHSVLALESARFCVRQNDFRRRLHAPTWAASDEAHTCWRTAMTGNGRTPMEASGLTPDESSPTRILEGFAQGVKAQVPSVPAVDRHCRSRSTAIVWHDALISGECCRFASRSPRADQKSDVPMVFVFVRCASPAGLNATFVVPTVCGGRDTAA